MADLCRLPLLGGLREALKPFGGRSTSDWTYLDVVGGGASSWHAVVIAVPSGPAEAIWAVW